jgi:ArsR family transcriptional regulator
MAADQPCASRLKILADPTRLDVLRRLLAGPSHVGDLGAALGVEQSLLSHHLRVLRDAGFVEADRDGKAVLYRISADVRVRGHEGLDLGCCSLSFE